MTANPSRVLVLPGLMLVGAGVALYPRLLPSSDVPGLDITVAKAVAGPYTVRVGLWWWAFGMCLAVAYLVIVYRMFGARPQQRAMHTEIDIDNVVRARAERNFASWLASCHPFGI